MAQIDVAQSLAGLVLGLFDGVARESGHNMGPPSFNALVISDGLFGVLRVMDETGAHGRSLGVVLRGAGVGMYEPAAGFALGTLAAQAAIQYGPQLMYAIQSMQR